MQYSEWDNGAWVNIYILDTWLQNFCFIFHCISNSAPVDYTVTADRHKLNLITIYHRFTSDQSVESTQQMT